MWYKHKPNPGHYTLSECELCLVGRKNGIPLPRGDRNIRQFISQKKDRHSAKPREVRRRIEQMFPNQKKIELFARPDPQLNIFTNKTAFDNWNVWGNEVESDIIL